MTEKKEIETSALSSHNLSYLESQLEAMQELLDKPLNVGGDIAGPIDADHEQLQLGVSRYIDAFRQLGNRVADTDPIEIEERPGQAGLDMNLYGLDENSLDKEFSTDIPNLPRGTLRQIVEVLQKTYCGTISAEFMHITDPDEREWFIQNYESTYGDPKCTKEQKLNLLERLVAADMLENYLNTRFNRSKEIFA